MASSHPSTTIDEIDAQRAAVGLLRCADRVRRHVNLALEPFRITGQQYNVLRILNGAHPDPLPTLEIANRVLERTPGMTRMLDRLEAKGLVARARSGEDRRQVLCSITRQGRELLEQASGPVGHANAEAIGSLSASHVRRLAELLEAITHETR